MEPSTMLVIVSCSELHRGHPAMSNGSATAPDVSLSPRVAALSAGSAKRSPLTFRPAPVPPPCLSSSRRPQWLPTPTQPYLQHGKRQRPVRVRRDPRRAGSVARPPPGVPRYRESPNPRRLGYLPTLGTEDLVPNRVRVARGRYRPRTEGLFAHIERRNHGGDRWEVRGKDGLLSHYGTPCPENGPTLGRDPTALAPPADPARVFAWKPSETNDPFGNRIVYDYLNDGIPREPRWTQTYLRRVRNIDSNRGRTAGFLVPSRSTTSHGRTSTTDHRAGFAIRTGFAAPRSYAPTTAGSRRPQLPPRLARAPLNGISLLRQVEVRRPMAWKPSRHWNSLHTEFDPAPTA